MKARLDILYHETWYETDPEYNYVRVELRRYSRDFGRADFILDSVVLVEGETLVEDVDATVAHFHDAGQLRVAIATFDHLKRNHPAAMAKPEDNNSLGSGQC